MKADQSSLRIAGWVPIAIVVVIFVASSALPFMRMGDGWPAVGAREAADVALVLVTWLPFVALLVAWFRWTQRYEGGKASVILAGHLLLFVVSPPGHAALFLLLKGAPGGMGFQVITFVGAFQYLVIVAVMLAITSAVATDRARLHAAELEAARATLDRQLSEARLEALTARLQPHFLFNTLNSVSILAAEDPPAARQMIARLSDLLRAVLSEPANARVTVQREIELVRSYVEIQRVRFGDRLQFTADVDPRSEKALIPPFILQPLAENAVEHAITNRTEPGHVAVRASVTETMLSLSVSDDGAGNANGTRDGHGIGLRATRERLAAAFGDSHRFDLVANEWGGLTAIIQVPLIHA